MFGAQSTLCKEDNSRVDVFRRGLGSIASCCQLALDFVMRQIVLLESPISESVCRSAAGWLGRALFAQKVLCMPALPSSWAPCNCSSKFLLLGRNSLASVGQRK